MIFTASLLNILDRPPYLNPSLDKAEFMELNYNVMVIRESLKLYKT
jgi:hypothetical protein